jgi:hypothetical protein
MLREVYIQKKLFPFNDCNSHQQRRTAVPAVVFKQIFLVLDLSFVAAIFPRLTNAKICSIDVFPKGPTTHKFQQKSCFSLNSILAQARVTSQFWILAQQKSVGVAPTANL